MSKTIRLTALSGLADNLRSTDDFGIQWDEL